MSFQTVEHASFVEIGHGHGTILGDGEVIILDGFLKAMQTLQNGAFFDQSVRVFGIEGQDFIETFQRGVGFIQFQESLAFAQQQMDRARLVWHGGRRDFP